MTKPIDFTNKFDAEWWRLHFVTAAELNLVSPYKFCLIVKAHVAAHEDASLRKGDVTYRRLMGLDTDADTLPREDEAYALFCFLRNLYVDDYGCSGLDLVRAHISGLTVLPSPEPKPADAAALVELNVAFAAVLQALQGGFDLNAAKARLHRLVSAATPIRAA